MNNTLAGTPNESGSDLYPEQSLTTQVLKRCSACYEFPTPHLAFGVTSEPPPLHYFTGRSVGDFRMTGSDELVNIPGHYVSPQQLYRVQQCDMTRTAAQRGVGWQDYNISSSCGK